MHQAIAGGAAVVLALTYSSAVWALTIAVAAIAWSRVELGDHTRHQVIGSGVRSSEPSLAGDCSQR
jgi:hypothetical protein